MKIFVVGVPSWPTESFAKNPKSLSLPSSSNEVDFHPASQPRVKHQRNIIFPEEGDKLIVETSRSMSNVVF